MLPFGALWIFPLGAFAGTTAVVGSTSATMGGTSAVVGSTSAIVGGATAIVGGTVAVGDGSAPIANGTVVFRDGRIVAAGADVTVPPGAAVVDAHGKWVAAGLMSGFTELGIGSYSRLPEIADASAPGSPFSAAIDVSEALDPEDASIQVDRAAGITRAVVSPAASKSIFGGQGAVIDLSARSGIVTRTRAFQFVELGQPADRLAGGSRPAAYAYFREALAEASDYEHPYLRDAPADARGYQDPAASRAGPQWPEVLTRADAAALGPVLEGQQPILVHVDRASDILHVLALKTSYPHVRLILLGAREGWRVAPQIAASHVPVIAAVGDLPDTFDSLAATESNVGRMTRAGVTVGLCTEGVYLEVYLRQLAASLVAINKEPGATGLAWGEAFAAVTSRPAQAFGLDKEIGSLRPGRHADVVIWDGDPLEAASGVVAVYIDGLPQPLDNHLTRLRERYRQPQPELLPKAYVH
jgi:imidazolonepropionase-like amidohydrolase